jgi:hypothetical protein
VGGALWAASEGAQILPIAQEEIFNGLNEPVLVLDDKNRILAINPAAATVLAIDAARSVGRPIDESLDGHSCWPICPRKTARPRCALGATIRKDALKCAFRQIRTVSASMLRAQAILILSAVMIVWLLNAVYVTGKSPVPNMDLGPMAFVLMAVCIRRTDRAIRKVERDYP